MRSRDLLLSAADYDWVTNYYTKWITGHEVQKTDTRYTMYVTHWTTVWTETIVVEDDSGDDGDGGDPGTPGGAEVDVVISGYGDIIGAWGSYILYEGFEKAAYKKLKAEGKPAGDYTLSPADVGESYFTKPSISYIYNAYIQTGKQRFPGATTQQIEQYSLSLSPNAGLHADHWNTAWDLYCNSAQTVHFDPGSEPSGGGGGGGGGGTTTKKVIRKRQTSRETVRQTTFKYYYWTYYQTSQATTRVTKWYTDKYSDTKMTGVDPNQRYQGHLLSVTYYDRNDESSTEYGYIGETEHEKVPVIRTGAYMPKIGSLPNRQAIDPNSNKWMESREDRQANQSMSKNVYSKNKNELLNSQSNKRNLQTYYVHNEEQETSSGAFGAVTK